MEATTFCVIVVIVLCIVHAGNAEAPLKLCRNGEHVKGKWVYNGVTKQANKYSNSLRNAPKTGNTSELALFCCPSKYTNRHTVFPAVCQAGEENFKRLPPDGEGCCECKFELDLTDEPEIQKWEWVPDNCQLLDFEAVPFCHALGNRMMQLVGDSLTLHTSYTIHHLIKIGGGDCLKQVVYGRSAYLHFVNRRGDYTLGHHIQNNNFPDITVMNSGAYLQLKDELKVEILPAALKIITTLEAEHTKQYPDARPRKYFFRTQYGGHANCFNHTRPLKEYNITSITSGAYESLPYNWHFFPQYDADAHEMLANSTVMKIIDASPLYLRADAHTGIFWEQYENKEKIDCLHYLQRGPLDLMARVFYTMLYTGEM